jgi:hypothetical protein
MEKQRYNTFDFIHKAWRALMYETARILQQTDFEQEQEAETAIQRLNLVLKSLEQHAYHENTFILPAVGKYDPEVALSMSSDHEQDEVLSRQLQLKIEDFRTTAETARKNRIGREMMYLFIDFVAFNLTHMNMEEHKISEVLWKHYTDEELMLINSEIVKSIPADEMMFSIEWMIRGISNQQILQLLNKFRKEMPKETFDSVCLMTETVLPVDRWKRVKEELLGTKEPQAH